MNPLMSLDVNLSYNLTNLAGKAWEDTDPTKDQRIDSYTSLNDEKDPLPLNANEHFIGNPRSINAIQLNDSILFGL
ncbi:MAG: hypothetical protein HYY49_05250 [Ignavibacteriales bacterium]|nr:hypothetical protein [Ignavibacteriales bacterium]